MTPTMILAFRLLAIAGVVLLWGVSLANGTVKALILAVWHGELSNGISLRRSYTGFAPLDLLITLLVAFFFYGTNSTDEGYQLFLIDAYSTLQSAFVWLYVEATRPGGKSYWISRPVAFGLLWQCLGGAISLPLYYAMHLRWASSGNVIRVRNREQASAIPWSFTLGAVVPAVVGMSTAWFGADSRTDAAHQLILGLWQLDPLWVAAIQAGISSATAAARRQPVKDRKRQASNACYWVRSSYLLAATSSALGHLYVVYRILASNDRAVIGFVRMYVPFLFTGPSGVGDDVFVYGPWLFLQYDLIIISLSSLSWAYCLLTARGSQPRIMRPSLAFLALSAGTITVGPGATVSLALCYREGKLADKLGE